MLRLVQSAMLLFALGIPVMFVLVSLPQIPGAIVAEGMRVSGFTASDAPSEATPHATPTPSLAPLRYAPVEMPPPPTLAPYGYLPAPEPEHGEVPLPVDIAEPQPTAAPSTEPTPGSGSVPTPAPAPSGVRTHTVQRGDELRHIAAQYGVTMASILAVNTIPDADNLTVGQTLTIPDAPH
jgi:nucleoid-associated protein YgaU